MLEEHRRLRLPRLDGGEFEVEINWSEDPKISESKVLRFHDGERFFDIKRDDLLTLMLVVGDANVQKNLLPMNVRRVRRVERLLQGSFKAKKNYTKGDVIYWQAPWIDEIPIDEEVLSGNIANLGKSMSKMTSKKLN